MAYHCLVTKPIQEKISDNMKYIFVTKEYPKPTPENGKKKCTKEQMTHYNDMMANREEMFKILNSGHFDIENATIKLEQFTNNLPSFIGNEGCYIYKINPINASKTYGGYGSREHYFVSKFDIEKKIETVYELIDDLSNSIYYADLFHYIFDRGHYKNKGYREYSIGLFKYAKKNHPDKKIYLSDCIRRVLHSYDHAGRYNGEAYVEEYVKLLLDNCLIELIQEYDDHEDTIKNLIGANWFGIARDYILAISEDVRDIYIRDIHKDESAMSVLRINSDKDVVKEIMSLLHVEDMCVVLKVMKYDDWDGEDVVETKTFKDMNEVRSYVIREYGVSFDDATKDIGGWHGENEEYFRIS